MEIRRLRYAFGESGVGTVLVAVGEQGLAAVLLGDNSGRVYREFVRSFPGSELLEGDDALTDTLAAVVTAVNVPGSGFVGECLASGGLSRWSARHDTA